MPIQRAPHQHSAAKSATSQSPQASRQLQSAVRCFVFKKKILQTMYIQKNMYLSYPFLNLKPIHKILPFDTFRSGPTVTI